MRWKSTNIELPVAHDPSASFYHIRISLKLNYTATVDLLIQPLRIFRRLFKEEEPQEAKKKKPWLYVNSQMSGEPAGSLRTTRWDQSHHEVPPLVGRIGHRIHPKILCCRSISIRFRWIERQRSRPVQTGPRRLQTRRWASVRISHTKRRSEIWDSVGRRCPEGWPVSGMPSSAGQNSRLLRTWQECELISIPNEAIFWGQAKG